MRSLRHLFGLVADFIFPNRVRSFEDSHEVEVALQAAQMVMGTAGDVIAWVSEPEQVSERLLRARLVLSAESGPEGKNRKSVKTAMVAVLSA